MSESGWLDELKIGYQSFGLDDAPMQLRMAPTAVRALLKGKLPPVVHHKRPGHEHVKRIFQEMEKE